MLASGWVRFSLAVAAASLFCSAQSVEERNGRLASEAFQRSNRTMHAWLARRDPTTGLLPRRGSDPNWTVRDSAADLYPFLVLCAHFTEPALYGGAMLEILRQERRLTARLGRLSDDLLPGGGFVRGQPVIDEIIFGSSEYVKDGLVPITELLGDSPWYHRMRGIAADLIRYAPYRTPRGKLPARSAEINGNLLQLLSRLYWKTGDADCLAQIIAIADFYLLDMLPATGFIPAHMWDFEAGKAADPRFTFSDHGNEIVSGLGEACLLMKYKRPDKFHQYREPYLKMIDRLLEVGRNTHNVWVTAVDFSGKVIDPRPAHCWGYLYKPVYVAHMISGERKYRNEVEAAIRSVAEHENYLFDETGAGRKWGANAYSDSLESALVLLNRLPDARFAGAIDRGMRKMLDRQRPDGIVEDWYGDGNYIRTALMYAFWKTQGAWLDPWQPEVRLGAAREGERVNLEVVAAADWNGRIRFDVPRHRDHWNMAVNYPRLNEFPEWFTVEQDALYEVRVGDAPAGVLLGAELVRGLPLEMKAGTRRRITVAPRQP